MALSLTSHLSTLSLSLIIGGGGGGGGGGGSSPSLNKDKDRQMDRGRQAGRGRGKAGRQEGRQAGIEHHGGLGIHPLPAAMPCTCAQHLPTPGLSYACLPHLGLIIMPALAWVGGWVCFKIAQQPGGQAQPVADRNFSLARTPAQHLAQAALTFPLTPPPFYLVYLWWVDNRPCIYLAGNMPCPLFIAQLGILPCPSPCPLPCFSLGERERGRSHLLSLSSRHLSLLSLYSCLVVSLSLSQAWWRRQTEQATEQW